MSTPPVVTTAWLDDHRGDPGVLLIDNSGTPEAYLRGHIPGAVAAPCHPYLKHFDARGEKTQHVMEPTAFGRLCHELGLRRDRHVVVCDDRHGLYGARFRAVCRHYGLTNVSVLDGGWNAWVAEGRPVATRPVAPTPGTDVAPVAGRVLADLAAVRAAAAAGAPDLWDVRHPDEFAGREDRDNARRGHVPGARHLEWVALLDGPDDDGAARRLRPRAELAGIVAGLGFSPERPVITYCQSGIRAAFVHWVLEILQFQDVALYDASMGEWANRDDTPLAGPA